MLPTPYYKDAHTLLYCADNRDILPYWPEKSVDFVLTDPPFSDWTHIGARTNPVGGHDGKSDWAMGGNEPQAMITFDSISDWDVSCIFDRLGYLARRWVVASIDWRHYAEMERQPRVLAARSYGHLGQAERCAAVYRRSTSARLGSDRYFSSARRLERKGQRAALRYWWAHGLERRRASCGVAL